MRIHSIVRRAACQIAIVAHMSLGMVVFKITATTVYGYMFLTQEFVSKVLSCFAQLF